MDPAQLVTLGRTDLEVSRLGLGTAPLGNMFERLSEEQARATIDAAWECGIRFFDTAPLYGHGLAERRLGEALAERPRDMYVLSTKVGRLLVPGKEDGSIFVDTPPVRPIFDFSGDATKRSIASSLDRLGLARLDVVHVHDPDDHPDDAIAGAFPVLCALRDEGVIGAVGAGMNQAPMLARFVREVDIDCVLLAGRYSLLDRSGLDDLLPLCAERGVAVIAGGVFNSGVLASGSTYDYAPAPAPVIERTRLLDEVCRARGVSLKAAALQFPFGHPAVSCVVVGARSPEEIRENAALVADKIPAQVWDEIA